MKSILELTHTEAKDFFLKEESYTSFKLPSYFVFKNILDVMSNKLTGHNITDFYENGKLIPCGNCENVNYQLVTNKDGKFAYRPLQLIHPALYVSLVHKLTDIENWQLIKSCLKAFSNNPQIKCYSIPLESEPEDKNTDRAVLINQWVKQIEQQSIKLSMKYEYLLNTDISDCYGSIYTHSIPWALHEKEYAKKHKTEKHLIGNIIDKHIQDMSYGQTNGIPQGSVLMDFVAEIVLGYADMLLSDKIKEADIKEYQIIRYRDDYRIFTNNPQDAEHIVKLLSEVMIELGLKINTQKTSLSNDIIRSAIKSDKFYWIMARKGAHSLQKQLLILYDLSQKYPNSGTLDKELNKFLDRIRKKASIDEDLIVLASIIVEIAYKNPRTHPVISAILSKLLTLMTENEKNDILEKLTKKFDKIPNTGYLQIWLQRITLIFDKRKNYDELLCKKVIDTTVKIWNSDWLKGDIQDLIDNTSIIDETIINSMPPLIENKEFQIFNYSDI